MKQTVRELVFASALVFSRLTLAQQGQADPIVQAVAGRWVQVGAVPNTTPLVWLAAPNGDDARFYVYQGVVTFQPFPNAGSLGPSLTGCEQVAIHLERVGDRVFRGDCDVSVYMHATFMIKLSNNALSLHVQETGAGPERDVYLIRSLGSIPAGLPFQSCPSRPGWGTECY